MASTSPDELTGLDNTIPSQASGISRNAKIRSFRSSWNIANTPSTTGDTLKLGRFKEGGRIRAFDIACSTNMSAASIAIGTAADPDKYLAAAALPNATGARRIVLPNAAGFEALTEAEDLIVTISGATIPNGLLVIDAEVAQR